MRSSTSVPRVMPTRGRSSRNGTRSTSDRSRSPLAEQGVSRSSSGAKYQISNSGGTEPAWRRDGRVVLRFHGSEADGRRDQVRHSVDPGTPQELFANAGLTGYAPSPDGQR